MCTMSCPTLQPMDSSLPGSSVDGIFPGKDTRAGCHFLTQLLNHWQADFYHCATWEAQEKEVQKGQSAYSNPGAGVNGLRSSLGICFQTGRKAER